MPHFETPRLQTAVFQMVVTVTICILCCFVRDSPRVMTFQVFIAYLVLAKSVFHILSILFEIFLPKISTYLAILGMKK